MNEIITINTNNLTNKVLADRIGTIEWLAKSLRANQKDIACIYGEIVRKSLYTDDFPDMKSFADAVGCSRATLIQFGKYYDISEYYKDTDFSFSQIVELFKLFKWLGHAVTDIETLYALYGITSDMTCSEIREAVKSIISEEDIVEAEAKTEAEVETESESAEDTRKMFKDYLLNLEIGFEIDANDIKIFKQIAKML